MEGTEVRCFQFQMFAGKSEEIHSSKHEKCKILYIHTACIIAAYVIVHKRVNSGKNYRDDRTRKSDQKHWLIDVISCRISWIHMIRIACHKSNPWSWPFWLCSIVRKAVHSQVIRAFPARVVALSSSPRANYDKWGKPMGKWKIMCKGLMFIDFPHIYVLSLSLYIYVYNYIYMLSIYLSNLIYLI